MFKSAAAAKVENSSSLCIRADRYTVKTLNTWRERMPAYRLRHIVFAEQLRWVPPSEDRHEIDGYDALAVHFAVTDDQENVLAYVRLLSADRQFMMEKEFLSVIGDRNVIRKGADTCELTRFCVAPAARTAVIRTAHGPFDVMAFLFKGVYAWCRERNIRFIYGITDRTIHKFLKIKGYPYEMIGEPKSMPDGVIARAVFLDWREFESVNAGKKPELLEWYGYKSMSLLPRAMASA